MAVDLAIASDGIVEMTLDATQSTTVVDLAQTIEVVEVEVSPLAGGSPTVLTAHVTRPDLAIAVNTSSDVVDLTIVEPDQVVVQVADTAVVLPTSGGRSAPLLGTRSLSYGDDGKLVAVTLPDGSQRVMAYNADGRLASVVHSTVDGVALSTRTLNYSNGRLVSAIDT